MGREVFLFFGNSFEVVIDGLIIFVFYVGV